MRNVILAILVATISLSCSSGGGKGRAVMADKSTKYELAEVNDLAPPPPASMEQTQVNSTERKLIKEAYLSIEVKEYSESLVQAKNLVSKWKGWVVKENVNASDYSIRNDLIIRVPGANFDSLVNDLEKVAKKITSKTIDVKDVTEEFVDVQARLKTKKAVELRYLDILKQAKTVEDILKVEEELGNIREEIESTEGRLKYLSNQTTYSTVNISIEQKLVSKQGFEFFSRISQALRGGWRGLLGFLVGLVYLWPFLLIMAAVIYLFIRYRRKKKLANR
jgi:hypothetical protein